MADSLSNKIFKGNNKINIYIYTYLNMYKYTIIIENGNKIML